MTGRGFTQLLMWNKKEKKKKRMAWRRAEKRKTAEKGQKGKWENRERDKEGLNGDRK